MKNETKMRPAIKNRILAVLAVLLLGVGILTSCVVFTDFMSHIIYEESTAHLTEIYHQANQTLYIIDDNVNHCAYTEYQKTF